MTTFKDALLVAAAIILLILAAVFISACGTTRYASAPSSEATQAHLANATQYNDVAVVSTGHAMTKLERVEAKAEVIKKYWRQ